MRMLYNFMSAFGEEVSFPSNWKHLEYYIIPTYTDVRNKNYSMFPIFKKLYHAITQLFRLDFTNSVSIDGINFKVMPHAWKQNKDDFITNVTGKYPKMINIMLKYSLMHLIDMLGEQHTLSVLF